MVYFEGFTLILGHCGILVSAQRLNPPVDIAEKRQVKYAGRIRCGVLLRHGNAAIWG
jgi:hypothetical protein